MTTQPVPRPPSPPVPAGAPGLSDHDLVERVRTYNPGAALDTLEQAYEFSATVHRGQRRRSGEPYLTHPLAVAGIIAEMRLDVPSVATGLLHDTVEDTLTTLEEIHGSDAFDLANLSVAMRTMRTLLRSHS